MKYATITAAFTLAFSIFYAIYVFEKRMDVVESKYSELLNLYNMPLSKTDVEYRRLRIAVMRGEQFPMLGGSWHKCVKVDTN